MPRRRRTYTPRRRWYPRLRRRGRRKATIPLAPVMGLVGGVAPSIMSMASNPTPEQIKADLNHLCAIYTGYSPLEGAWHPDKLWLGLGPLIGGFAVHKIADVVGINRMLASRKIPYIRI